MCFISISLAHGHTHTHTHTHAQTLFPQKELFHVLSTLCLCLGSALSFASVVAVRVVFAVQPHFLMNGLFVCLVA